jgi:hypothetical protein
MQQKASAVPDASDRVDVRTSKVCHTTHLRKLFLGEGHSAATALARNFDEAWLGAGSYLAGKCSTSRLGNYTRPDRSRRFALCYG